MTDKNKVARDILSDITVHMKYARYLPEKERRETWTEIVDRNKAMHVKKYPELEEEISNAYQMVYSKKVLPSMRSMQFGGKPIEVAPNHRLMTGECLARLCSYSSAELVSDTVSRSTT